MSSSIDAATRLERDRRMFERSIGGSAQAFIDGIAAVAPDFGPLILEWEFADVYSRDTIGQDRVSHRRVSGCDVAVGISGQL